MPLTFFSKMHGFCAADEFIEIEGMGSLSRPTGYRTENDQTGNKEEEQEERGSERPVGFQLIQPEPHETILLRDLGQHWIRGHSFIQRLHEGNGRGFPCRHE